MGPCHRDLRNHLIATALVFAAFAVAGCSVLVDLQGLSGGTAGTGPLDASAPSGNGPDATAPVNPSDSSSPGAASDAPSEVGASDGSSAADTGGAIESGPGVDASQEAGATGVACGAQTCAAGNSVCCYSFDAGPVTCASSCPSGQLALPCDDTADCVAAGHPGSVCCATFGPGPGSQATSVQCTTNCPTNGATPMCDPNDPTTPCQGTDTCQLSTLNVPGYYVCK